VTIVAAGVIAGNQVGTDTAPHPAPPSAGPAGSPPIAAPAPAPSAASDAALGMTADFARLQATLNAAAGIAVSAVGSGQDPMTLGDWQSGVAWSTIKVPLIIAALRQRDSPTVTAAMRAAITESDNAAAESVWASLGDPVTAAHKVEDVLRQTGDPTTVQWQKVRPEYTAFGQTDWSLANQARFVSAAVCNRANAPVFDLMGQIEPDQSWGIGTIGGTQFKGGWGPSPAGSYLVRQIGVLTTAHGRIAVALAAAPASGKFDDGTAALTAMASWLTAHLANLPSGQCNP
jgi:hypothetical protein